MENNGVCQTPLEFENRKTSFKFIFVSICLIYVTLNAKNKQTNNRCYEKSSCLGSQNKSWNDFQGLWSQFIEFTVFILA